MLCWNSQVWYYLRLYSAEENTIIKEQIEREILAVQNKLVYWVNKFRKQLQCSNGS